MTTTDQNQQIAELKQSTEVAQAAAHTARIADLEQLAMHRAKIAEEIKNLDDIRKEYDEKIAALAGEGTTTAGAFKVTVTVPKRLDAKKIEAAFPVAQYPTFYKRAVDTTAVKDHIAKVDLEAYQTAGSPTVRVS